VSARNDSGFSQWLVGIGAVAYAIGHLSHHQVQGTLVAVGCGVLVVAHLVFAGRSKKREKARDHLSASMGKVAGVPVSVRKCKMVDGRVSEIFATYDAGLEPTASAKDAVANLLGPVKIDKWEKGVIKARRRRPINAVDHGGQVARAEHIAQLTFGPQAYVDHVIWADKTLHGFVIHHPPTMKATGSAFCADFDRSLGSMLGRRYTPTWESDLDKVTYTLADLLPSRVDQPADSLALGGSNEIPFAENAKKTVVSWRLDSAEPHCLIGGATGTGKSAAFHTFLTGLTARGAEVRICDIKRTGLLAFRQGWPGITEFSTSNADIAATILGVKAELDRRTLAVEQGQIDEDDLPRLVLAVDEILETLKVLQKEWTSTGRHEASSPGSPAPAEAPAVDAFGALLRLGRSSHIHVVAASQRLDITKEFTGDMRDNFGLRVLLGIPKSDAAKKMMAITMDVTRDAEGKVPRGRAIVDVGTGEQEVQVWYTVMDELRPRRSRSLALVGAPAVSSPSASVVFVTAPPASSRPVLQLLRPLLGPVADPIQEAVGEKRCSKCQTPKPIDQFTADRSRPDGKRRWCRDCERTRRTADK
jgi:Bacterial protein of unknown function (DUF853)